MTLIRRTEVLIAAVVLLVVVGILIRFPQYSETILRLERLPPSPSVTAANETLERWTRELLLTAHNLVYYVWVVGAVAVGGAAALSFLFFQWWAQHSEILKRVKSWEDTLDRSQALINDAVVDKLPLDVSVDFRDPSILRKFQAARTALLGQTSLEELDQRIAITAMMRPVPGNLYLRLGNYFRFKAASVSDDEALTPSGKAAIEDSLWCAIRRYQSAMEAAKEERGRQGRLSYAYASHGVAVCLILLERNDESVVEYSRQAVERLTAETFPPDIVSVIATYGLTLKRLNRFEQAIEVFERALALQPFDVETNYNLACALARWGDSAGPADELVRDSRYRRALSRLQQIVGHLEDQRHVIGGLRADDDFAGIRRHATFAPGLAEVADQLLR